MVFSSGSHRTGSTRIITAITIIIMAMITVVVVAVAVVVVVARVETKKKVAVNGIKSPATEIITPMNIVAVVYTRWPNNAEII